MEKKTYQGLSLKEVEAHRAQYGRNEMTPSKSKSLWVAYFEKFSDPMIIILLVALFLSFGLSAYEFWGNHASAEVFFEPLGIFITVVLATSISFFFENQAEKEFAILNQVNDEILYKVIREGEIHQVLKKDIVQGDIIILETGEEIPADGVLLDALLLQVNESSLTGEPVASKHVDPTQGDPEATYPSNRLYRSTVIVGGHCIMQVTAVGDHTEAGSVFQGIQLENDIQTPLNQQLTRLAKMISFGGYILATLVVLVRFWAYFREVGFTNIDWINLSSYALNTLMLAVTLIVMAVPEGLPMSISLSLAYSMRSMMKTNNLVRRMHACETLGATTVICTDKTGTLTQNQMRVHALLWPDGTTHPPTEEQLKLLSNHIAANTTAHLDTQENNKVTVVGNPTEGALLLWLYDHKINYLKERNACNVSNQLPFSTERKYMATEVTEEDSQKRIFYLKGAPEYVKTYCTRVLTNEGVQPIDSLWLQLQTKLQEFQKQGMRTLALAQKVETDSNAPFIQNEQVVAKEFVLVALVAISDPIREDVPDAIQECIDAGINVKIVTGDTLLTAREIARQIGLWNETLCKDSLHAISGPEFANLTDEEAYKRLPSLLVMYRARPMDKARLINLLQNMDEVVAVTGDGTNDAPALRAAHVGLSMGDGTAVAKTASDMTILDNSFVSIGKGIMWGRSLYQNIQRFILFQLTINVAACMIVLIGSLFGENSPLTITQILWINLIMDTFAALALASLPPNPQVMKDPPRSQEDFIITRSMSKHIISGGLLMVVALFTLLEYFDHIDITTSLFAWLNHIPSDYQYIENNVNAYEGSLFFATFVFFQLWNLFNAKAYQTGRSAFHLLHDGRHKKFLGVLLITAFVQVLLMIFGGKIFNIVPLAWQDQLIVLGCTSLVLWIGEAIRWVARKVKKA